MTGPFRPPGEPPFAAPAAPAAASASIVVAVGCPAFPPPTATAAASAAVDLTFSNAGDDSDDSGIRVGPPLRPAGNKGKTPCVCLTGDILRVMQDKLTANATSGNVNATLVETMKRIFEAVVGKRGYLLKLAGGLDTSMEIPEGGGMTIRGLLTKAIPVQFAAKTTKSKVCEFMVNVWAVLQVVIANVSNSRDARHDLQQYFNLLTRIEAVAGREISETDKQDKNAKSVRLPGQAMERMYLTDRGSKSPLRFLTCARCGNSLLDEPPFNKDYARANKAVVENWAADDHTIEEYASTGCNPLLDKKGAIVRKLKNPILKEEVLMCHWWHNFASPIAGGTACALLCYDSKTKTQYAAGKCSACSCSCAFVCTKK
jgi:hypothetical protein